MIDWDTKRLLQGCAVYNVRNCREIDIYRKINEFYKKLIELSFKYDFPTLVQIQDDSILVLLKCVYPKYFIELDPNVCITYDSDINSFEDVQHYHFLKSKTKPWLGKSTETISGKYLPEIYERNYEKNI